MAASVAYLRLVNPPNSPYAQTMTWPDERVMDTFSAWLRANNCNEGTIADRIGVLNSFARDVPGFPHVDPGQVTAWIGRPGFAQWTRATYFGHLQSYFRFAVQAGLIEADPMSGLTRPKHGRGVPRPLTPEQVRQVLDAAGNPNLHAWLTLGLFAGLRAHEIAKIRGEDVDVDNLYVFGKGGQGAFLPTHPLVWELALSRPAAGWWFPTWSACGHVRSLSVSTMTSRLFKANGIEGSIHRCRHTYATQLLRAGVNIRVVQTLMRHESLSSTQIYTAVDEVERRAAIRLLAA